MCEGEPAGVSGVLGERWGGIRAYEVVWGTDGGSGAVRSTILSICAELSFSFAYPCRTRSFKRVGVAKVEMVKYDRCQAMLTDQRLGAGPAGPRLHRFALAMHPHSLLYPTQRAPLIPIKHHGEDRPHEDAGPAYQKPISHPSLPHPRTPRSGTPSPPRHIHRPLHPCLQLHEPSELISL